MMIGRHRFHGDLILRNGSVHRGGFVEGRASGPGVLYDATGAVLSGSWLESKRVGAFVTIDPKGGEWADTYDASGTRTSRKKSAPAPADGAGAAQKCRHCAVKFHGEHNSSCRQHSGKWLTASEVASDAVDAEYPEGGMWLCCGKTARSERGCTRAALHVLHPNHLLPLPRKGVRWWRRRRLRCRRRLRRR